VATEAAAGARSEPSIQDLAAIRGLGPGKRAKLIERFGSVDGIAAASVAELSAIQGIGAGLAETIKDTLNS
jgi:excinuclease ABC subunit C